MHDLELLRTLTAGLFVALVLGYITQRLSLSPIVGYLLAGVVVGPHTPGPIANQELANEMAHIGVILLMFGVGLHFHLKDLLAVRRIAIPGAVGQSLVATVLGCIVGLLAGWALSGSIVFGLAISVASTVVLLRVLADSNELHTPTGHIAVGWLVVEDIFTVLVLVLLPVIVPVPVAEDANPADRSSIGMVVFLAITKIGLLVAVIFVLGGRLIPWLLTLTARARSRELFTLAVLVLALGLALGAASLFGVSMELGAFLAGMVVGQSEFSSRAASEALPLRDAFAVLFFVSVGMLFDPLFLLVSPGLVLAALAIVMVAKPAAALAITLLLNYPLRTALSISVALAQIGEFSFILATLGQNLKILPESATSALVAAALISISLNPLLYRSIGWIEARLTKSKGRRPFLPSEESLQLENRAVVVGYGPVGRTLVRLLQENGIEPIVVEMNVDTVHRLRDDGIRAIYGDSTHRDTLLEAGIEHAMALILSSAGMHGSEEAIRLGRELNPKIRVIARAAYLKEIPALRRAGADLVFSSEGEVALSMTEHLMRQLGATEEQIDRQRERTREELFGSPLVVELLLPVPGKAADPS
jgi:CPA2 family monovalent cation:H+ antiporter-2